MSAYRRFRDWMSTATVGVQVVCFAFTLAALGIGLQFTVAFLTYQQTGDPGLLITLALTLLIVGVPAGLVIYQLLSRAKPMILAQLETERKQRKTK